MPTREGDQRREMSLGAFLFSTGHHVAAWRHGSADADASVNLEHWVKLARSAEEAKLDLVFIADTVTAWSFPEPALYYTSRADGFEPTTLLSALAMVTKRIGLVATATTSYNEPYNLARRFASLDLLSAGRAGWNLVTSATETEALNFNRDGHFLHADRYARARECAKVVLGLWKSFEPGAFLRDTASGEFLDPAKVNTLDHQGPHFRVKGPLNVAPSRQGRPVVFQAGSSEPGRQLAAETADVVFTAQTELSTARAFYADINARAEAAGRASGAVKVMPGVMPIVGRTRGEAEDKFAELQALIRPEVGLTLLSNMLGGADLSHLDLDGPMPATIETNSGKSRAALLLEMAHREGLTVRELYLRIAGARGHWSLVGNASDIADELEAWFVGRAADGFNIMPATLPGGLGDFIELVLPELRRRGLFRTEYASETLQEHLGLPTNRSDRTKG